MNEYNIFFFYCQLFLNIRRNITNKFRHTRDNYTLIFWNETYRHANQGLSISFHRAFQYPKGFLFVVKSNCLTIQIPSGRLICIFSPYWFVARIYSLLSHFSARNSARLFENGLTGNDYSITASAQLVLFSRMWYDGWFFPATGSVWSFFSSPEPSFVFYRIL